MVSDGKYLWVSRNNSFNNLVVRYDPATLQALDQKHNPVFSSNGLAWDGANFWVVDIETRTIAKLQLSGN
jgi:sugar lactone lactonase YvrE